MVQIKLAFKGHAIFCGMTFDMDTIFRLGSKRDLRVFLEIISSCPAKLELGKPGKSLVLSTAKCRLLSTDKGESYNTPWNALCCFNQQEIEVTADESVRTLKEEQLLWTPGQKRTLRKTR